MVGAAGQPGGGRPPLRLHPLAHPAGGRPPLGRARSCSGRAEPESDRAGRAAASAGRHHAQPRRPAGVPGRRGRPEDVDAAATALREATEEVGLDPATATVVATLPRLWIPVSGFVVTPVLAWWHAPAPGGPGGPGRGGAGWSGCPWRNWSIPANRVRVRHPSGYIGPAFDVRGMLVWGFTAGILNTLLDLGGWSRPWDENRVQDLRRPDPPPDLVTLTRDRTCVVSGTVAVRCAACPAAWLTSFCSLMIIVFAINGYRQGFLVGALSFVGFFGGALVGLQLAPLFVAAVDSPAARVDHLADRRLRSGPGRSGRRGLGRAPAAPGNRQPHRPSPRRRRRPGRLDPGAAAGGLDDRRSAGLLAETIGRGALCPARCSL